MPIFRPGIVKKALRFLKTRGLRDFVKAFFIMLSGRSYISGGSRTEQIPWYLDENSDIATDTDIAAWMRDNFSTGAYACNCSYQYERVIYIIIPVYNGLEYFDKLFESIQGTNLRYHLLIIDDCSTDERVRPYLQRLTDSVNSDNSGNYATLIINDENLGFVKSVNKALRMADNHAALLNTDIELPRYWLERLMHPILFEDKVASSSPFTNCGVICSFPGVGKDNALFEGLSYKQIDEAFSHVIPSYYDIPTGVGYCMGMNYEAIQAIGIFDEESFHRGYGEENDWCRRAVKAGFKNVMTDNLFVYHKHAGSFSEDEKEELMKRNSEILFKKHPDYQADVAAYYMHNPARHVRNAVSMFLLSSQCAKEQMLYFTHTLGGGAAAYLDRQINTRLQSGMAVITVSYDNSSSKNGKYLFKYAARNYAYTYALSGIDKLKELIAYFPCLIIYINSLVLYPDIYKTLQDIIALKESARACLIMLVHDYYSICPALFLLDKNGNYCGIPKQDDCKDCFCKNNLLTKNAVKEYKDIPAWRAYWSDFLMYCDKITVFSESSKQLLEKTYGDGLRISVTPHETGYADKVIKQGKTTKTLNIGILGVLSPPKGLKIVQQMISIIKRKRLNVRIILIGCTNSLTENKYYKETGVYSLSQLPVLTQQHDIDIFFIPSICPETFSFTCQEAIDMDMPVACFNIGAPPERVRVYDKGLVIDKIDAEEALRQIQRFIHR